MVRLVSQQGFAEWLLGLFAVYPNRCQVCARRFLAFRGWPDSFPKRDFQRLPVRYPIWFRPASQSEEVPSVCGTMVNLSIGGCRIEGRLRVPKGSRLRLQFEVSGDQAPITIDEAVVHSHPRNAIGVRFTKLDKKEKRRLARVVRRRLSGFWTHPNQGA